MPALLHSTTVAMILADARLPTGGHAHSAGLEPALRGGMSVDDVPAFLRSRAVTTSLVDAGTAVVAMHAACDGLRALAAVERAWAARTPSQALRETARALGRGYLRLATRLWPDSEVLAGLARTPTARPVAIGVIAAETRMAPADVVRAIVYDDAACAASALLKLEPRDPAEATAWVLRTCAAVEDRVPAIAALTDPADIPASSSPQTEEWAEAHALLSRRLFRA